MTKQILITGGAGFIGSHLADALLARGHRVRVLDNLSAQVHGSERRPPSYLNPEAELVVGDIQDSACLKRALEGVDAVYHLASMVGVGQSMYMVREYVDCNSFGTATLLQTLIENPVARLIVASSMSIYGEGLYLNPRGEVCDATERTAWQLARGDWEVRGLNGEALTPAPTPETKCPVLTSVYALSKYDQERLCLMVGRAYGIPTVALRFFNVFGMRQALGNPYTGVMAIFATSLLNSNPAPIFEDGRQRRDFVSVHDVVQACCLALESDAAASRAINVGSGHSYTILEVFEKLAKILGAEYVGHELTEKYRTGDIRHCFADISLAREILGYEPLVSLDEGMEELGGWLHRQVAADRAAGAKSELIRRGLLT